MKKPGIVGSKSINDLVAENYIYASVLYYFGIRFYDYSTETLSQVCANKGLDMATVVAGLESVIKKEDEQTQALFAFPIDLIIEYLKHKHFEFVKQELPYISKLIAGLSEETTAQSHVAADLRFVFPLFVEDFIHHIYEEEDTLFTYIISLNQTIEKKQFPAQLYFDMEKKSIQRFAMEHDAHDDEMMGIRNITGNYNQDQAANLHLKVVYAELKAFEEKLKIHARVENEILFPKALMLEKQVKKLMADKITFN